MESNVRFHAYNVFLYVFGERIEEKVYDNEIKNRMKRIEGQVKAVLRMMEEERDCKEIVTQMSAARNALDRAIAVVVSTNLEQCVREQIDKGEDTKAQIEEAVNLLVKSR